MLETTFVWSTYRRFAQLPGIFVVNAKLSYEFQYHSVAGLGRVLDKSTRVQVQVLEKMTSTSTSTSTGFSKVLEYKYKYFEKYLSTSTEYFGCKL